MEKKIDLFGIQLHRRRRAWRRHIAIAIVVLVLSGCGTPTVEDDPKVRALSKHLGQIDAVKLEDHSTSEPVSVETPYGTSCMMKHSPVRRT